MNRGLQQSDAAELIGVSAETVRKWELGHAEPALRHWPAIIEFLGLVPFEIGETLGERIRGWRKIHGVSRAELAHRLGVDVRTVWWWEGGEGQPSALHQERVEKLLKTSR